MADQGARSTYNPGVYLSVTDDANRWRAGPPLPQHFQNEVSKVNMLMSSGLGLAIEKNLSKYDIKVLAAEARKQNWIKDLGIGPKSSYVVYIIKTTRIRDGASCVAAQRYSALRNLYNNLKSDQQIRTEGAPEFPGKRVVTEESFKGDRADVSSEFVKVRKEKLGTFLRQLFNKNPELWDVPEVQEFFNLEAMERGKSYAERAHSMAAGGLRTYDPSNPSEWNPYSVAMQAAEANRNRNHPPKSLADVGVVGPGSKNTGTGPSSAHDGAANADQASGEAEGGGGLGGWFRGFGGGGKNGDQNEASAGETCNNSGGGAWAARPGWLGGGGDGAGGVGGGGRGLGQGDSGLNGSLAEVQVRVLVEMGFPEETARAALKASGYDTNLAAEYCVTGIPRGRQSLSSSPPPPEPPQAQRPYLSARGSGFQSSVSSGFRENPRSWQPGMNYGVGVGAGGGYTGGGVYAGGGRYGGGGGYGGSGGGRTSGVSSMAGGGSEAGASLGYGGSWTANSSAYQPPEGRASPNGGGGWAAAGSGVLDSRTMPRRTMGGGTGDGGGPTSSGGTIDV